MRGAARPEVRLSGKPEPHGTSRYSHGATRMPKTFTSLIAIGATLIATAGEAKTLTAVCPSLTGRSVGVHGVIGGKQPIDEPDGYSQSSFTLDWTVGEKRGFVTGAGPTGGRKETGTLVLETDEQLSFIFTLQTGAYLVSIFPFARKMLFTEHAPGRIMDSGGAVNKAMISPCSITFK